LCLNRTFRRLFPLLRPLHSLTRPMQKIATHHVGAVSRALIQAPRLRCVATIARDLSVSLDVLVSQPDLLREWRQYDPVPLPLYFRFMHSLAAHNDAKPMVNMSGQLNPK
jgi:hypothetical protein